MLVKSMFVRAPSAIVSVLYWVAGLDPLSIMQKQAYMIQESYDHINCMTTAQFPQFLVATIIKQSNTGIELSINFYNSLPRSIRDIISPTYYVRPFRFFLAQFPSIHSHNIIPVFTVYMLLTIASMVVSQRFTSWPVVGSHHDHIPVSIIHS